MLISQGFPKLLPCNLQLVLSCLIIFSALSDSFKGEGGVFALRCLLSSAWRGPAKTQDAAVHRAETEAALNRSLRLNCRSSHWNQVGILSAVKLETPLRCNPLGSEVSPRPLPLIQGEGWEEGIMAWPRSANCGSGEKINAPFGHATVGARKQ